jgi:hypothetical protein
MELADLLNKTAEVTNEYNGFTTVLRIFTEKLTPEYKARLLTLAASAKAEGDETTGEKREHKDENALLLVELIEAWDIVLHGEPFAPVYENLIKMSFGHLASITKSITSYLGDLANPQSATN